MLIYMNNKEVNLKNKTTYELIDIIKFVFAIFVVGIHTNIMNNSENDIQWYILHILFRMAVPFFFVCSGFFFGRKIKEDEDIRKYSKKQIKRLMIPYVFWLLIELPYIFINTYDGNIEATIANIIKKLIFYPWGALWFVLATIIAIILSNYFIRKNNFKYAIILSIILYIIALLGNSYYFLLEGGIAQKTMDIYLKYCISVRNGIFVGFPMFTAGILLSKKQDYIINKYSNKKLFTLLIISIIIQVIEITIIRNQNYRDDHSLFFSTILIASLILIICIKNKNIKFNKINTLTFRNLSTGIYFMHRPIIDYNMLINPNINHWLNFVITIVISIMICLIAYKINNRYINCIIK